MNEKTDHLKKALDEINAIRSSGNQNVLVGLDSIKKEIEAAINAINKDDLFISNFSKSITKEAHNINLEISKLDDHVANRKPNRTMSVSKPW